MSVKNRLMLPSKARANVITGEAPVLQAPTLKHMHALLRD